MSCKKWIEVVSGPSTELPRSEAEAENTHISQDPKTVQVPQHTTIKPFPLDAHYQAVSFTGMADQGIPSRRLSSDACSSISRHSTPSPSKPKTCTKASKRQRQSEASKRFRLKKEEMLRNFKTKLEELDQRKFDLSVKIGVLENERHVWTQREQELLELIESLKKYRTITVF